MPRSDEEEDTSKQKNTVVPEADEAKVDLRLAPEEEQVYTAQPLFGDLSLTLLPRNSSPNRTRSRPLRTRFLPAEASQMQSHSTILPLPRSLHTSNTS